jgi:hypothetical protein
LVDVPLLRLWGSLGDQSDNYRCAGVRRDFGGERDVPDPRSNPALFRPVSGFAVGDPTDARGDRQIAPRAGITPKIIAARRLGHSCSSSARRQEFSTCEIQAAIGMQSGVAIGPPWSSRSAGRRPKRSAGDIRIETTSSLWSARISASKSYVVGCYGPVALDNRWKRASLITSDSALLELVGYVEAARRAACRFALKEVWKGIETKCPTADQAIGFKRFVVHKFTRFCLDGYIKYDMRSGSRLRQDTRPDFTDHRY